MTPPRASKPTAKPATARRAKPALEKVTTPPGPVAPAHLRPLTAAWWVTTMRSYALEEHHQRLLTLAAESWDRAEQARELLEVEGIVVRDRFGFPRAHPAVAIERDSRLAFVRTVRELDLEGEPLPTPRPPRRRG